MKVVDMLIKTEKIKEKMATDIVFPEGNKYRIIFRDNGGLLMTKGCWDMPIEISEWDSLKKAIDNMFEMEVENVKEVSK